MAKAKASVGSHNNKATNENSEKRALRKAVFSAVGSVALVKERGGEYLKEAYKLGEKVSKEEKENPPASNESTPLKEQDVNMGADVDKESSKLKGIKLKAKALGDKGHCLRVGLKEKLVADKERLYEAVKEKGGIERAGTQDKADKDEGSKKAVSRLKSYYTDLNKIKKGLLEEVNASVDSFGKNAENKGKSIEYDLRKQLLQLRKNLEKDLVNALDKAGFATKSDVNEINRKLVALGKMIELTEEAESENVPNVLERRVSNRRKKTYPVEYEKRIEKRRKDQLTLA